MKTLRTPDDRFANLPGYDFEPHYAEVADSEGGTLRVHYLREGDPAAPVVLLMHGEPSWSYLYRKMIPVLTGAGLQIVAPDLVGFGRSDKPTERSDYTFARHVEWMRELLFDRLDLRDVTLVVPGLGRAHRPAPGRRAPRPLRPGRGRQHLPAHRRHQPGGRLLRLAAVLPGGRAVPDGRHRAGRVRQARVARGRGGLRRALPRRVLQGGGAGIPDAGAVAARRPRARRQRRRLGGPGRLRPALPVRLQRQRPHHEGCGPQPQGEHRRGAAGSPTPPSSAAGTSSRRTAGRSWPRWSSPSSPRPRDPRAPGRRRRRRLLRHRHGGAAALHGHRRLRRPRPRQRPRRHLARQLVPGLPPATCRRTSTRTPSPSTRTGPGPSPPSPRSGTTCATASTASTSAGTCASARRSTRPAGTSEAQRWSVRTRGG